MAHNPETKARALTMLLTGDAPAFVVKQTGVPYATIKRWQGEAFDDLRGLIGPLDLGLFDFSQQNGHKKNRDAAQPKRGNRKSGL